MALALSLIHCFPPVDDFDPENPFWNGLSVLSRLHRLGAIDDIRLLPPRGAGQTLLVVGPSTPFEPEEAKAVAAFLMGGGKLVLADDFGSGNQLLEGLGLRTRILGHLLADPLFNARNSRFPRAPWAAVGNATALALNYASALEAADDGAGVLAWSSSFSYLDLDQDGRRNPDEPLGPFPVVAEAGYGGGRVYVISDSSVFINGLIELDDNRLLLRSIASEGNLLVDTSHWSRGVLASAKAYTQGGRELLSRPDARYALLFLSLAAVLRLREGDEAAPDGQDEVDAVMTRHPDWDREALQELRRDMEEHGHG